MSVLETPTINSILQRSTMVESWTVDDVAKSLKKIETSIHKLEIAMAKQDSNIYGQVRDAERRNLAEIRQLIGHVSQQLNKVLQVS